MSYIGQEEAKKLGYTVLHHTSSDKKMACYLNEDGFTLTVVQKDYNEPGKLVATIAAMYGMTNISSPEISFPHPQFDMFENEVYICTPVENNRFGGNVSISEKQFDRWMKNKYKSLDLINSVKEVLFGKKGK